MRYLFGIIVLLSVWACGGGNAGDLPKDDKGREDFEVFHQKFFVDTAFQMARIEFPMLGSSPNGGDDRFFWVEENWKFIKAVDADQKGVEREVYDMDNVMRERILVQDRFMIQLMYSLINNKWYLTEYSGIRDIAFFTNKKITPKSSVVEEDSTMMEDVDSIGE